MAAIFSKKKEARSLAERAGLELGVECKEYLEDLEQLPGGGVGTRKEMAVHHGGPNCRHSREFVIKPVNTVR